MEPKRQDTGAPSDHPRTHCGEQGTETRRDPGIQSGHGETRLGRVTESAEDAGGSFRAATSMSWPAFW